MSLAEEESVLLLLGAFCGSQMWRDSGIRKNGLAEFWRCTACGRWAHMGELGSFKGIKNKICWWRVVKIASDWWILDVWPGSVRSASLERSHTHAHDHFMRQIMIFYLHSSDEEPEPVGLENMLKVIPVVTVRRFELRLTPEPMLLTIKWTRMASHSGCL